MRYFTLLTLLFLAGCSTKPTLMRVDRIQWQVVGIVNDSIVFEELRGMYLDTETLEIKWYPVGTSKDCLVGVTRIRNVKSGETGFYEAKCDEAPGRP